jgi:hypothetical protein
MDELRTGMRALARSPDTGLPVFSDVFMWLHRVPEAHMLYFTFTTALGAEVTLWDTHYIHVTPAGCPHGVTHDADTTLLTAQDVQLGQGLWVHDIASGAFACSPIVRVDQSKHAGAYSPLTLAGNIVVDSVLASVVTSYEEVLNFAIGETHTTARRLIHKLPTLYFGNKRTPPMMVHHWIMVRAYTLFGQRGLDFLDALNAPLFAMAGIDQPTNSFVASAVQHETEAAGALDKERSCAAGKNKGGGLGRNNILAALAVAVCTCALLPRLLSNNVKLLKLARSSATKPTLAATVVVLLLAFAVREIEMCGTCYNCAGGQWGGGRSSTWCVRRLRCGLR